MNSIYRRLLGWFLLANVVTLLVSVFVTQALVNQWRSRLDLEDIAQRALEVYAAEGLQGVRTLNRRLEARGIDLILLRGEQVLAGRRNLSPPLQRRLSEWVGAERRQLRLPRGGDLLVLPVVPATADGPDRVVVLRRGTPPGGLSRHWLPLAVQVALSIAVIALVGWIVARGLTAPLNSIQQAVRRFAAGELGARVDQELAARSDEYGRLAADFNAMATRIQTLVESRDRLLHDVSHEIRSPLGRLRFAMELAQQEPAALAKHLARADTEIARIDALVDEILALARLDSTAEPRGMAPLDLAELAQACVDAARIEADHAGVRLQIEAAAPLLLQGQGDWLQRAIDNLLRNAIRHSPAGGSVQLSLRRDAGAAVLQVSDQGPGVDARELAAIFEPFHRVPGGGSDGHGLGLAIVAGVARAHQGRVGARNREDGGLEVTLELPLPPA